MKPKTDAKPAELRYRGFAGAFTDPRSDRQILYDTLRLRKALAVLTVLPDLTDGPTTQVVTWDDARGERCRKLISVTTLSSGKVFYDAVVDAAATTPQKACDNAAIGRRLAEYGATALRMFTDSMTLEGDALANADEMLAAGRIKPAAAEISSARSAVRDAGGAMTMGALKEAGFPRRLVLALVLFRHLAAERGRRFTDATIISL